MRVLLRVRAEGHDAIGQQFVPLTVCELDGRSGRVGRKPGGALGRRAEVGHTVSPDDELRDLLPIAAEPDWRRQRRVWRERSCNADAPNSMASLTPFHGCGGSGGFQRHSPTGGAAYGIPRKTCTSPVASPASNPLSIRTVGVLITAPVDRRVAVVGWPLFFGGSSFVAGLDYGDGADAG